jgi:hypothetical protein
LIINFRIIIQRDPTEITIEERAQIDQERTGLSIVIDHPIIRHSSVFNTEDQEVEVLMRTDLEEVAEAIIDHFISAIKIDQLITIEIVIMMIGTTSTIKKIKIIIMNRLYSRNKEVITHLLILKQQQDTKVPIDDIIIMISQGAKLKRILI